MIIDKVCNCPLLLIRKPTCASDGETYASECAAICKGGGVKHKGSCDIIGAPFPLPLPFPKFPIICT